MTNATRRLDLLDNLNGSVMVSWQEWPTFVPASYNVYVNGVLQGNTTGKSFTVTGLQIAAYNATTGVETPPGVYTFKVVALNGATEASASLEVTLSPAPTSIALVTPMKRPFPFPNVGY